MSRKKVKEDIQKEEVVVKKTHLTFEEIKKLDIFNIEERIRKQELELIEVKRQLTQKAIECLTKDLKILEFEVLSKVKEHEVKRAQHVQFVNEIKLLAEIKGNLGFDPNTGELV